MKVYASLKEVLHDSYQQTQNSASRLLRVRENYQSALTQIDDLEKTLVQRMDELKLGVVKDETSMVREVRQLKQVVEALKAKIGMRELQLKEAEHMIRTKDSAYQKMQESFNATIRDLQDELTKSKKALQQRDAGINDLKLQGQGLAESALSLKQAEGFTGFDQSSRAETLSRAVSAMGGKAGRGQIKGRAVRAKGAGPVQQMVPSSFFDSVINDLSEILGPLASLIIYHDVVALGESMEEFPKTRLLELIEIVSKDIADEYVKISFRERFLKYV